MKKIISLTLALICFLSAIGLSACSREKVITIGEETLTLPADAKKINFALPPETSCIYTSNGTEYDLYNATLEELQLLSQHTWDTVYPGIADKQTVAELAAAVFSELFPEKEIVTNGTTLYVKLNPISKCIICTGTGNDGGYAALAINRKSGEIVMIAYGS